MILMILMMIVTIDLQKEGANAVIIDYQLLLLNTSGYPRSDPIRLNNFSLALSLIGFFQYGLPGQTFFVSQDKTYRVPNVPIVGLF